MKMVSLRATSTTGLCVVCVILLRAVNIPAQSPSTQTLTTDTPTAQEIVSRYYDANGMKEYENSVDNFVVGDSSQTVTGICVTATATVEVIHRAAEQGLNFIIAHEPTFYSGRDQTGPLEDDDVFNAKRELLRENKMVIWRNHDHIHRRQPDGIVEGMSKTLGWDKYLLARAHEKNIIYRIPETTVRDLAKELAGKLKAHRVRIVGDPELKSGRIGLVVGAPASMTQIKALQRDDVEILVAGETREWETVEYVRDASTLGMPKALILLGHLPSEEEGMRLYRDEIAKLVPHVPVKFIPAGDPFWSADQN